MNFLRCKVVYLLFPMIAIIFGFVTAHAADKKDKAESKTQETQQPKQPFIPCKSTKADFSPQGKYFLRVGDDSNFPVLLVFEHAEKQEDQKNTQIRLPKKAYDVVFIDDTRAIVSYGPWGELAVVNIKDGAVDKPFKVGESAEAMCKTSEGKMLVLDSEKSSMIFADTKTQKIIKTYPVKGKAAQMRWLVPDLKIEIADAEGKALGTFKLPQQAEPKRK